MKNLLNTQNIKTKSAFHSWREIIKGVMLKSLYVLIAVVIVIFSLPAIPAAAGTTLSPGDIVFIGINSDGDDDFSFLLLKDITAGTYIYISDKGWNDATGFRTESGDGIFKWSTASDLSAGTIVHIKTSNNGTVVKPGSTAALEGTPLSLQASKGTVTWIEDNGTIISYCGDQVFLYQGTHAAPNFITGIHYNVEVPPEDSTTEGNWDGSSSSNKTSALPNQLTNGVTAIWVYQAGPTERDNFKYDGSTNKGTPSELRAAINNLSNWDVDDTNSTAYTIHPFPTSFTVLAAVPTISNINPASGTTAGGTSVTITGTDFTGATAVKFGSTDAAGFTVNSATSITAISPAGSAGVVDITVTTAGGTSGPEHFTYIVPNSLPVASDVQISGTAQVGQVLTGSYTYTDAENDVEGTSTFKWYRSNDNSGTGKVAIAGATASTYTLVAGDAGKYISFEVTPVAVTGNSPGAAAESGYTATITAAPAYTGTATADTATPMAGAGDTITLTVKNSSGNTDTTFTGAYDVTISGVEAAPNSSYGNFYETSLTGSLQTISVTFSSGIATANLSLNKADEQIIEFRIAGVRTPATNSLTITPNAGAVASLVITSQPEPGAVSGDAFAMQPKITLKDQYGNNCTNGPSATANVVATAKAGTGTWSVGGTTTKAAVAGVAAFTDLTCTLTSPGNGAITFTGGLITVDSNTFNIPTNAAKTLTADTTNNNVDNDIEITFAADATFEGAITGVSYKGTDLTVTTDYVVSSGKVTLKPSEGNTVLQTSGTGDVVITATEYNNSTVSQTIDAGTVASLVITTQPEPGTASGNAFARQPKITLKDQYGNNCTNGPSATANVVATAKAGTGTWSVGGTTTKAAVAGVAAFTDLTCTLTSPGNGAITFTGGLITVDSNIFNIPTNVAKMLTADITNNNVDNDIEITFAADATFEGAITGVSYKGTDLTVTTDYVVSNGKVTLKPSGGNAVLQTPGTGDVVITATGYNNSTVSQAIDAGAVASLVITTQPEPGAASGDAFATQPEITLKDQYGNNCTNGPSATANVVATAKAGTGTWSVGGTTTKAAVAGVAAFTDLTCTLTSPGNGAITFTGGLIIVDSNTFNIPTNAAKTLTADITNNNVDNDIEITFAADATFEGAITGVSYKGTDLTVTTDYVVSNGKVTLKPSEGNTVLQTSGTGDVVITATGYNNSTVSQTIDAGTVASLVITTQPEPGTASGNAFARQPKITLKDKYGNNCTNGPSATANVVATAKAGTGTWSVGGTTTKAAVAGVAAFTDLTCTLTSPGNGAITFTGGLITVDSNTFNIPTNAAKTLTADITNNNVDNDIEITFATDVTFEGAITGVSYKGTDLTVTTDYVVSSGKVTLKPSGGNAVLQTPGTGDVVITATGYNNSIVSQAIDAGAVASMSVTQDITAPAANGGQFAQQPVITLKDIYGNACTNDNTTVITASKKDAGSWTLTGTTTVTASSGVATFTDLGASNEAQVNNAQLAFNGIGSEVTSTTVTLSAPQSSSSGGDGGGSSSSTQTTGVNLIVNGQSQTAGTETVTETNGQTTVELVVNSNVINQKIDEIIQEQLKGNPEDMNNIVEVPVSTGGADNLTVSLTGDVINNMEYNGFTLSVESYDIDYIIPAEEIDIEHVAENLGVSQDNLHNIKIEVKIDKVDDETAAQWIENANAQDYEIVFPPVNFSVVAKTTSSTGEESEDEISTFSQYVERVMEIPAGVDPSIITTGIVFNADGTVSPIPTEVFCVGRKYYARLSSLTNSAYSVIYNPITVKSVENHWAKIPVNDMASRMVIKNPETFIPNGAITRGEFAEYITKALGLYRTKAAKAGKFTDVSISNELADAITIATDYGIISGYPDGTFRPDNKISREEAMAMYSRAMDIVKLGEVDNNKIATYKDVSKVSSWAYLAVKKVVSANVFNGRTVDTIVPKGTLTYAEAATAIRNMLIKAGLINS